VATAAENRLSSAGRNFEYTPLAIRIKGHVFASLLWIVVIHLVWALGDAFFVPAAKAPKGSLRRGDRGHAQHHQSLALGIGVDALGELYWLPD
jgi:hypothetical protein